MPLTVARPSCGSDWKTKACADGMRRWLLVRDDAEHPDEERSFLADGPDVTDLDDLIRVCATRWRIEDGVAEATGEVGLDEDEVRKWNAWHPHVTRCLLAHA